MQFNPVNKKEMLVFQCIWVHDGAVCLAVNGLKQMCTGSCRSCGLSVVAIWNLVGIRALCSLCFFFKWLFFPLVLFLFFCFPPTTPPFFLFLLLSQCHRCLDVPAWGLMAADAWVMGLLVIRVFHCPGAG